MEDGKKLRAAILSFLKEAGFYPRYPEWSEKEVAALLGAAQTENPESSAKSETNAATDSDYYLYVDGAARGNPGPAGAGVVIEKKNRGVVRTVTRFLGTATNNSAEYQALILGLTELLTFRPQNVTIFMDSELVVKQIQGEYRVKNPSLKKWYQQVQALLSRIPRWTIRHVPRGQNRDADRLANRAIDSWSKAT